MITTSKANKQAYSALFEEASKALNFPETDPITNITQYFESLGQLANFAKNKADSGETTEYYKFIRLPISILDDDESENEPVFTIDANKRSINVPTVFKKGISVEGDHGAETVYFIIDRYFDAQDLAEDTKIIIQWETAPSADKKAETESGASEAFLVDKDSYPTKLVFGWVLDNRITKRAGVIKFSIRIYQTGADKNGKEIITYSFSTTNSTATIQPALNYDLVNEVLPENNSNLILNRLVDSKPSKPGVAEAPRFIYTFLPSQILNDADQVKKETFIDEDGQECIKYTYDLPQQDVLASILKAQAITDEASNVQYFWSHKTIEGKNVNNFIQGDKYISVEFDDTTKFDATKTYYKLIEDPDTKISAAVIIDDVTSDKFIKDYVDENGESITVYERFGTITIDRDRAPITGTYRVSATNRLGASNVAETSSDILFIPGPTSIKTYLNEDKTIAFEEDQKIILKDGEATLKVFDVTDGLTNIYTWFSKKTGAEEFEEIEQEDKAINSYQISVPEDQRALFDRTYQLEICACRNGDTLATNGEEKNLPKLNTFRVTDAPHELTSKSHAGEDNFIYFNKDSTKNVLDVTLTNVNEVLHDQILYTWYKYTVDADNKVDIPDEDKNENGDPLDKCVQETSEISTYNFNDEGGGRYYCKITNIVNGQEKDSYTDTYTVIK